MNEMFRTYRIFPRRSQWIQKTTTEITIDPCSMKLYSKTLRIYANVNFLLPLIQWGVFWKAFRTVPSALAGSLPHILNPGRVLTTVRFSGTIRRQYNYGMGFPSRFSPRDLIWGSSERDRHTTSQVGNMAVMPLVLQLSMGNGNYLPSDELFVYFLPWFFIKWFLFLSLLNSRERYSPILILNYHHLKPLTMINLPINPLLCNSALCSLLVTWVNKWVRKNYTSPDTNIL